jgi:succinoglycan biosynthesis transport protein ExoP
MRQFFAIAWAHRYATLIIFFAIVLPTVAVVKYLLPRTYMATATLMVDSDINDKTNNVSTRIQLMESPKILMPVIDKMQLDKDKDYTVGYHGDPSLLTYHVMDMLIKNLDIEPGALGSELLTVTAFSNSPVKAADIANLVAGVYADQEPGPAAERAKLYSQQLTELKNKVNAAQEQVTAFRQRTGVAPDLTEKDNIEAALLTTLEERYQEAQNQRRAAEVKAGAYQATGSGFQDSPVTRELRTKLSSLESQLALLTSTMGSQHPRVLELKSEIASTQKALHSETSNYSSQTSSDLAAAKELESKLGAAVEQQRLKVLNFKKIQEDGNKYLLELESAQTVYKRALDGYDAIMFTSGGHGTNVKLVSPAVPPLTAAKPNKIKILGAASLMGLLLGLLAPLTYDLIFDRRIRCIDDVERSFDIPVLIELDALPPGLSVAA